MAKKVQEIQAKLTGDNSDLVQALNDAGKKIKKTAQDAEKQTAAAGEKMNDALAGVGTMVLEKGIEKFGQAVEWVSAKMSEMADIGREAERAGLDPVLFQQLSKTADASGYSFDEARKRFSEFESVLMSARAGNQKANLQLQAIGTSVEKLQGLSAWDAFAAAIPKAEEARENLDVIFGAQAVNGEGFKKFLDVAATASTNIYNADVIEAAMKYQQAIENLNNTFVTFMDKSGAIDALSRSIQGLDAILAGRMKDPKIHREDRASWWKKSLKWAIDAGVPIATAYNLTAKKMGGKHVPTVGESFFGDIHTWTEVADADRAEWEKEYEALKAARGKAPAPDAAKKQADEAVRQLHRMEQEAEAAETKARAEEAAKMRRMTPREKLNYLRDKAVDELMRKSPELTREDAASKVLREEAEVLSRGKMPQRWTDAGAKTNAPMDEAARALLKAADRIDKDGFYVKRKN